MKLLHSLVDLLNKNRRETWIDLHNLRLLNMEAPCIVIAILQFHGT